jgi:valyl-tRNA synthetase
MALSKNYLPGETEQRWYAHWMQQGYFHSEPDERKPFTVVIPPPNVTGVLHMGHTLNETVQDILVRRARMQGYNACWVPGSDHASIATEARVVAMLSEKGIRKADLSREEFLAYAFQWKEKYGGIIYKQIARLGCSCDWDRVTFTMDQHYYSAVIKVFVELYHKGLIYRGARMIHWDPAAQTALSDEEVEYREVNSKFYYVRYPLEGSDEYITVATTRPETIPGDTAICVNPTDTRYAHLVGKHAIVPVVGRRVPVIADDYVDASFGTGCLKVTPAHDINDYNLGLKHHLEVIDVFNPDGTMSEAAGVYPGEDRFEVRRKFSDDLRKQGFLVKEENILNKNGFSQRSHAVVEPRISTQWFLKMEELAAPALAAVTEGDVTLFPEGRFTSTYRHWLENIKDWCISRQLWWGQRIPAWYDNAGNTYVAETAAEALEAYRAATGDAAADTSCLRQDSDVLDTWFSSWLWPMEVFSGVSDPGNEDVSYYYPTSVLVTGQDIIFFWVARMIMAGLELAHKKPFSHVYFTGMVRDSQGRKMSKSLGNSPDLLELIDRYGADAVRFGILIASPAGGDLLFEESSLEQGRNFCNKLWNALKLIQGWNASERNAATGERFAVKWFAARLQEASLQLTGLFESYRLSEALKVIYSLIWDDFCSWYLEWVKPSRGQDMASSVKDQSIRFMEDLLQMLHPFMPFVTEEIYHLLVERLAGDDLIVRQLPRVQTPEALTLEQGELARRVITAVREVRAKSQLKHSDPVTLYVQTSHEQDYRAFEAVLSKQLQAEALHFSAAAPSPQGVTLVVDKDKIVVETHLKVDPVQQREKLLLDLERQKNFLLSVEKKLANEKFLAHAAPELVARERQKHADASERIRVIQESLSVL